MSPLAIELLEGFVVFRVTLLHLFPVLDHINVLQLVKISPDIVRGASFSDIDDALITAIDIEDGGAPRFPIEIGISSHDTLDNGIAHIEIIAVATRITQKD